MLGRLNVLLKTPETTILSGGISPLDILLQLTTPSSILEVLLGAFRSTLKFLTHPLKTTKTYPTEKANSPQIFAGLPLLGGTFNIPGISLI